MKTMKEKIKETVARAFMGLALTMAAATPVFAAITDAGENFGSWIQEQGYYVALGIVVVVLIKFLLKKAWVPAAAFLLVGGILVFIIGNPEALKTAGQSIYNMIVQ